MDKTQKSTSIWNPGFIGLFFSSICLNLSTQMSNSLLSLYAKNGGAPADQIGSLMSMFAITALFFRLIAGPMMNAYNKKRLLQMAMFFFGVAYVGFGMSLWIVSKTGLELIKVLKFFRLVQGMGNAFGNSCLLALVSDVLPKDKFSSGMSFYALAQSVAQAIGPTIGVKLKDAFGYNTTFIVSGCLMFFSIILVAVIVKIENKGTGKFVFSLSNIIAKEALLPASITLLIYIGFTSINSFLLVYAEEIGIEDASLYFTVYAAAMFVSKPVIGKLTDKYGFVKVAIPSVFLTALSLFLIGQCKNLPMLLLTGVVNACGYGAAQPALQSMAMKSVTADRRGSASSTNYIAMDAGTLIGPVVCGYIAKMFGYTPIMWTVMTVPVLCAVLVIFITRNSLTKIETDFANR